MVNSSSDPGVRLPGTHPRPANLVKGVCLQVRIDDQQINLIRDGHFQQSPLDEGNMTVQVILHCLKDGSGRGLDHVGDTATLFWRFFFSKKHAFRKHLGRGI